MSLNNAFRSLGKTDIPTDNVTASVTQLPASILDAFIPGYSVASNFIWNVFGFDISLVVSISFLVFGLFTSSKFVWHYAYKYFEDYCTSFICIESGDDIFDHVMEWLAEQKISKKSRTLMAKTGRESAWDSLPGEEINVMADAGQLLNFSNWDAKVPPTFQPYFGTHRFWHNGRYFEFSRSKQETLGTSWGGGSVMREEEYIKLTCIGRSTQPLKALIKEARDHYLDKEKTSTVVRRPAPKEMRGRGRNVWNKVASRPSRPIETVVLDHEQKDRLLADINEYLHPKTAVWYANRGIPYRRGYLLAGPPGTGKSSLAWAIAGVFGLDIYCISLVEPTLTEEDLGVMFTSLPRRCVVLLEDIDAAGLVKRKLPDDAKEEPEKETSEAAKLGAEISKAIKASQAQGGAKTKENQGISLSGLLNAIDGVASHEGRVLLMTTNCPEKLDEALIRPGRIDMKIAFTKATKNQMRELFVRMYEPDVENGMPSKSMAANKKIFSTAAPADQKAMHLRHRKPLSSVDGNELRVKVTPASVPTPPESPYHSNSNSSSSSDVTPSNPPSPPPTELHDIAVAFAKRLPEETFTPAEIQGFLLTRKNEPLRALEEVIPWRDQLIRAKHAKNGQVSNNSSERGVVQRLVGSEMDYFCDCKLCRQWEDEEAEWENEVDNEAADYDNAEDVGDDDASGSEDSYYSDGEYY
ncbi:MAG: hypothetical protein LQ350_005799 [Teloschistes chrysophthalmus]|nr:MAG: hypothetical protein LQ350_005799 [Niorma chrysophthalma]